MENSEYVPKNEQNNRSIDFCPTVKSFQTDQGSVYEKLSDGTFRRHKYDATEYEAMEWTMFTDREGKHELQMIKLKQQMMPQTKKAIIFEIVEFDENGDDINRATHRDEVVDINHDFDLLTIEVDGINEPKAIFQTAITFKPKVGYYVFEFSQSGAEYHHGDSVSNIEQIKD